MSLRPARAGDAKAMARVHAEAFAAPWSAHEVAGFLGGPGGFAVVVEDDEAADAAGLAGFILCRAIAGEAEVLTLAVVPGQRRRGVARALLQAALGAATAAEAEAMFLEVADNNAPAIALYEAAGFEPVGRRPGYYADAGPARDAPRDAVVMRRRLNT